MATTTTETQYGFSDVLAPYAERLLGQAAGQTDINNNPYLQYQGERYAQYSPLQTQSYTNAGAMQPAGQIEEASKLAGLAAAYGLNNRYDAGQFKNTFTDRQPYTSGTFSPNQVQAQSLYQNQMGPAQQVNAQSLYKYQMDPAQQVDARSFTQAGEAAKYSSPYMQQVVDIQKREAQRQADIAGTQRGARAAGAGAFGGARQAIENAEAQRNLATQMGDIQATGSQAAYQQGQQQFNAEQAARLQAQQANQQAGLTVGQQNLGANLGVQQLSTQAGLQAQQANQQAGLTVGQQNLAAQQATQQLGAQTGLQAALANQQAGLTVGQQNLAAQQATQQLGAQTGLQAQLANQQYGLNAQQMAEQSRQFGATQGMTGAQLQAQYGQSAQQLAEQARQYGAGLGMQGAQLGLSAAGQLGTLGGQYTGQMLDINKLQNQYGGQQQTQAQNILSGQYQDFLNAQQRPYQQMAFMSDMIRGLPLTQQSQSMFTPSPSTSSQALGLGTAALGFSRLAGMAGGGYVGSGLADLAIANMA